MNDFVSVLKADPLLAFLLIGGSLYALILLLMIIFYLFKLLLNR
ncbi:hypothetical protein [Aquibacillus albus]|uniref:Uncharacterized protein n=1 Tax=Aquibacillus albus TaxID=1168171 RepID=A0ABS2MX68_9BACI|nr:hypothetical protein [Aquibacillus albus]MBM7570462.1 hypothetical protein [Aquibacillus albus]